MDLSKGQIITLACVALVTFGWLATRPAADESTRAESVTAFKTVTRAQFGDRWPFTVESGRLRCDLGNHVVMIADGEVYAVNGSARGAAPKNGWRDSRDIVKKESSGALANVSPIIEVGLTLCK